MNYNSEWRRLGHPEGLNPGARWDGGSTEELAEQNKPEIRMYLPLMIYSKVTKNHDFHFHLFVSSDKIYFSSLETKILRSVTVAPVNSINDSWQLANYLFKIDAISYRMG